MEAENLLLNVSIEAYVDYLVYVKYQTNANYSLKNRTALSMQIDILDWHENSDFEEYEKYKNKKWKGNGILEVEFLFEGNTYLFKEITTGHDLYTESKEMKHCVFSYIENCLNGWSSIWSMQKLVNGVFVRQLTIEIVDTEILQISGMRNSEHTFEQIDVIEKWTERMHYTF